MPLYEYACGACGSRREVRHGVGESPSVECAGCGAVMARVFTVPAGGTRRIWNPWATSARSAPARDP